MKIRTVGASALVAVSIAAFWGDRPNTSVASSAEQHWVGSWAASPSDASQTQPSLSDQTLRMIVAPHLGGKTLRVHLSNRFGTRAITLDQVDIGLQATGASLVPGSDQPVTFGGSVRVTIAAGHDAISDPVALTFEPFQKLAVSVYVDAAISNPTEHRLTRQTNYLSPAGTGDHAGDDDATAYTRTTAGTYSTGWYFLDGIDVRAAADVGAVVAFGDSITDGYQGHGSPAVENQAGIDANGRYPDDLARRLIAAGVPLSVLNAGIGGNRILKGGGVGGPSGLARLNKDVIGQAGVSDVIVLEGINDIGTSGAGVNQVNAGLKRIVVALHHAGLRVQLGTITPAEGTKSKSGRYGSAAANAVRVKVNRWIRTQPYSDGVIDFDRAVRDPAHAGRVRPSYDGSDHLHLNVAGYRAMAASIAIRNVS